MLPKDSVHGRLWKGKRPLSIHVGLTASHSVAARPRDPNAASGTPLAATNEIVGGQRLQAA